MLKENFKTIISTNKGKDFFQRQKELFENEPARFDSNVSSAEFQGSYNAGQFLSKVKDWQNPEHKKAVSEYLTKFDSSEDEVHKYFTAIEIEKRTIKRIADIKHAEVQGKIDAEKFKASAKDFNAPDHAGSVSLLKILGTNNFLIDNYFIERLYKEKGLTRVPVKSEEFEKSLTAKYKPQNEYEAAALSSLKDFLSHRFSAVGYAGIESDIEAWQKENIKISQ